jgi:hypothetical protein
VQGGGPGTGLLGIALLTWLNSSPMEAAIAKFLSEHPYKPRSPVTGLPLSGADRRVAPSGPIFLS